jgi:hypothetical protein
MDRGRHECVDVLDLDQLTATLGHPERPPQERLRGRGLPQTSSDLSGSRNSAADRWVGFPCAIPKTTLPTP